MVHLYYNYFDSRLTSSGFVLFGLAPPTVPAELVRPERRARFLSWMRTVGPDGRGRRSEGWGWMGVDAWEMCSERWGGDQHTEVCVVCLPWKSGRGSVSGFCHATLPYAAGQALGGNTTCLVSFSVSCLLCEWPAAAHSLLAAKRTRFPCSRKAVRNRDHKVLICVVFLRQVDRLVINF